MSIYVSNLACKLVLQVYCKTRYKVVIKLGTKLLMYKLLLLLFSVSLHLTQVFFYAVHLESFASITTVVFMVTE